MVSEPLNADEIRELEALVWESERRGLVPPNFGHWLDRNWTEGEFRWDYRHMRLMQQELDRITAGEIRRLMFQVAGRHSKTEHVTRYVAYRLDMEAAARVLFCTYDQEQANRMSDKIKDMVLRRGVALGAKDTMKEWRTTKGGGLLAVGVGAGTASVNADLIVIDDPIGKRADAESFAHRQRVWDWLTTDILARCEPHTAVVFSMPRWHEDDPAGRLQDRQGHRWTVVDLPGRAEEDDVLGRQPEELLWPELRGDAWHEQMHDELASWGYASFIQCRPRPREGGLFKWEWFEKTRLQEVPAVGQLIRYWDVAGTAVESMGHDPDYTAGALLCRMTDGRTVIVDMARFRESVAGRDAKIVEVAKQDRRDYGGRVKWWFETETGIKGKERTAQLVRRIQNTGMAVYTEYASGKKEMRWEPLAAKAEAGNLWLVEGDWVEPFLIEAVDAPGGRHDDQLDAASGADAKLSTPTKTAFVQHMRV